MAHSSAVICEFNPLHRGHEAVLRAAGELSDGAVIAVMSGNFTQRSECAVFDKYKRAKAAVLAGADLVLELPFPWCSAGGEFFALGGVSVALGVCADGFVFGSESGSSDMVRRISELSESREYKEYLDSITDSSSGAASANDAAMKNFGYSPGPNDKLAAEYMRAARRRHANVSFTAVRRMTEKGVYKSAAEIRGMLESGSGEAGKFVSSSALPAYGVGCVPDVEQRRLEEIELLFFRLAGISSDGRELIRDTAEGDGGVRERLISAARRASSPTDFYRLAATKKYTFSRLRRASLFAVLGVREKDLTAPPRFTRLLAANGCGRAHLSKMRKSAGIAVITKPSAVNGLDGDALRQYELSCRADELYSLCLKRGKIWGEYLRRSPFML